MSTLEALQIWILCNLNSTLGKVEVVDSMPNGTLKLMLGDGHLDLFNLILKLNVQDNQLKFAKQKLVKKRLRWRSCFI